MLEVAINIKVRSAEISISVHNWTLEDKPRDHCSVLRRHYCAFSFCRSVKASDIRSSIWLFSDIALLLSIRFRYPHFIYEWNRDLPFVCEPSLPCLVGVSWIKIVLTLDSEIRNWDDWSERRSMRHMLDTKVIRGVAHLSSLTILPLLLIKLSQYRTEFLVLIICYSGR